ncbi:hypothetical protein E0Z10_g8694 [Xylaria hypoxylon]|uniref:Geranylgeranyl pyrophosphate synthetase n=1 Tax=Xylaria hypoxylon TaxID=37992 RepID=A0A4Z0YR82_9PEZI|nr:hypothetical protein E0Z10_g8694 [Xylaria hypoxylon]
MIHGDLSNLRRECGASSSAKGSFRGSWRGSKGGWHHRKNRISKKADEVPLGRLVTEFTLKGIASSAAVFAGEARITNCAYAASYSLNDEKPFKVVVPGQPAAWKPPPLPCQLPGDRGDYMRDQNSARFPDHPIQPAVQALFALDETFDPSNVDVIGCASSLGDILRFVRLIDSTFRFDVEVVGNTLFLIRNCQNDVIPDVRGFGHSFLNAFTSSKPNGGMTKSHQRVVSYDFGDLRCLVRFECDGYLTSCDGINTHVIEPQFNLSAPPPESITVQKAGMLVPQDSVLEIKTKSQTRGEIQMSDHLPRLWVRQIPHFVTAYHCHGTFQDVQVGNISKDLIEWETQHQDELKSFASILHQLITEVKRASHLKLEIFREGLGPLQIRERTGAPRHALSNSWRDRWVVRAEPNLQRLTTRGDSDEDSEPYPSTRISSDESDGSMDDFSLDYTACGHECGYCGHCA